MSQIEHKSIAAKVSGEGSVEAEFSVFDVEDRDGDIVTASALQPYDGKEIAMVWSHDWAQPVGKGRLVVSERSAIFAGTFLSTQRGAEAYETVKQMGDLQQWSWGFRVTESDYEKRGNKNVRMIKGVEPFEVSPVLIGANQYTSTLAVKSHDRIKQLEDENARLKARIGVLERGRLSQMQEWLKEAQG